MEKSAASQHLLPLLGQVATSLPPALSDLYRRGKLRMKVVSLRAGSVVVRLRLTVQDPEFPVGVSTLSPMLPPLWASTVFQVDQSETFVQGGSSSPCPGCAAPMPSKVQAALALISIHFVPKDKASEL